MIIFIYGKDTYRSHKYLRKMTDKFKAERDPAGYNTVELDALVKQDAARILEETMAVPFLAERRMLVLKHLLASKENQIKEILLQKIKEKTLPESNVLVLYEAEDSYKSKLDKEFFELLLQEKFKEQFRLLESHELGAWIEQELNDRGAAIERPAVSYLATNDTGDGWALNSVLDQLVAYSGNFISGDARKQTITVEMVKEFVPEKIDDNIFNLVDAIIAGQKKKAFGMIRAQYSAGNDSGYVFAMILRQFKILISIKDAIDRGITPDAKALGLHPYVLKKTTPVVGRYSMDKLTKAYSDLLNIDIQTKTGQGDQSVLLDVFVGAL